MFFNEEQDVAKDIKMEYDSRAHRATRVPRQSRCFGPSVLLKRVVNSLCINRNVVLRHTDDIQR